MGTCVEHGSMRCFRLYVFLVLRRAAPHEAMLWIEALGHDVTHGLTEALAHRNAANWFVEDGAVAGEGNVFANRLHQRGFLIGLDCVFVRDDSGSQWRAPGIGSHSFRLTDVAVDDVAGRTLEFAEGDQRFAKAFR